jgi:hypothetical protein
MQRAAICVWSIVPVLACAGTTLTDSHDREQQIIRALDQAWQDREAGLAVYSVTEHYAIRNSRLDSPAEATVAVSYTRGVGKTYRVISRSGSSLLQTRVLERLIKAEEELSRPGQRQSASLISANYQMKLIGEEAVDGRPCDVLMLTPRARSPHLLKGKAWLDSRSHALVRLQGRPTASISFLAGRPEITRDYEETDGFSLARRSRAISETFLLGRTELTIDYTSYKIAHLLKK